jgi:Uma2 family endonuclease
MVPTMNVALRQPLMTRDQFFQWAQARDERYEFDGFQPVAMTGGNLRHNIIHLNIHTALRQRLRGTGCRPLGADAGVATIGDAVRYPDALVTCTPITGDEYVTPNVVVVFEVVSPTSGRTDRIVKVREYAAVPSILRYVIVESASIGLTVLERQSADQKWTASTLMAEDTMLLPEIGIEIPVAELYEGVDFPMPDADAASPEKPAESGV